MRMILAPRLFLAMKCKTCGQLILSERVQDSITDAALFGFRNRGLCIGCFQEVCEGTQKSKGYQKRWDKLYEEKYGKTA